MKIKNILISQPAPADFGKSPYADLKKKYSINIDFYKFFKIESVSVREFRDSKIDILKHSAIIFSSKNTIDQFFNIVKEMRIQMPESMKYFCPTESTAFYLQKYIQFRKRKIFFGKNNNPNSIFDFILKNKEHQYLIPCGSDSTGSQFSEFLEKHNISYTPAIVFNTVPADLKNDIDISKYEMIVLFSPAGVQSLRFNFPDFVQTEDIALGGLGNAVANAIEAEGWTVNVLAPTPQAPSMTAAMDIFLKDHATRRR